MSPIKTVQAQFDARRRELDAEAARTIQAGRSTRPEWT